MRLAQVFAPGDIRVIDAPVPQPSADQALVKVIAYAPYGTDVGVFLNRDGRYVKQFPVGVGADFSGVVAAIGSGVANLKVGDRVSALALDHCGRCANCRRGKTNRCLDPAMATVERQTCCGEYTLVTARKLARLPDTVTFDDGAMLAGVVDGLNACELMGVKAGDTVAVIGVGAMGQGAIAAAIAVGAEVVAVGGIGLRVRLARDMGARTVIGIAGHDEDVIDQIKAVAPIGFDYVIETTTSAWGLRHAMAAAAMGGAVAVTGGFALPALGWDLVGRELTLFGIRGGHHQEQALAMIAAGKMDLKPTISARFPLARVAEAFALLTGERREDLGRVMIDIGVP